MHTFLSVLLFTRSICEPINHTFFVHTICIEQSHDRLLQTGKSFHWEILTHLER